MTTTLQLVVARGAAYYGLVRRGHGVRIGSDAARTYYLGLDEQSVLCLVPRGMEEGKTVELADRELELLANRPVAFPLFTTADRAGEQVGAVVSVPIDALTPLPPIRTGLRFGKKLEPVHLEIHLTEIDTLAVWLRSRTTKYRWRLEFQLRDTIGAGRTRRRGVARSLRRS